MWWRGFQCLFGAQRNESFLAATGMQNANVEGLPTFPSWQPKRELDFIFYSKDIHKSDFSIPLVPYSDHLPLVFDFDLK
jgi:endonuclease/exonuclease/phosphatase family metal-dependent hydrolase